MVLVVARVLERPGAGAGAGAGVGVLRVGELQKRGRERKEKWVIGQILLGAGQFHARAVVHQVSSSSAGDHLRWARLQQEHGQRPVDETGMSPHPAVPGG